MKRFGKFRALFRRLRRPKARRKGAKLDVPETIVEESEGDDDDTVPESARTGAQGSEMSGRSARSLLLQKHAFDERLDAINAQGVTKNSAGAQPSRQGLTLTLSVTTADRKTSLGARADAESIISTISAATDFTAASEASATPQTDAREDTTANQLDPAEELGKTIAAFRARRAEVAAEATRLCSHAALRQVSAGSLTAITFHSTHRATTAAPSSAGCHSG